MLKKNETTKEAAMQISGAARIAILILGLIPKLRVLSNGSFSTNSVSARDNSNGRFGSLPDAQYTSPERPLLGAYRTLELVVIDSIS